MKIKRWLAGTAALAGAALLWLEAWSVRTPPPQPAESDAPLWILRDHGGRLAQFAANAAEDDAPMYTWQVYTALLPQDDLEKLQAGIPVYTQEQLRRLVEDLGG